MSTKKNRLNDVYRYCLSNNMVSSKAGFAQMVGRNRSNIYSALKGDDRYLTDDLMRSVAAAFPSINKSWLLTGEGAMLNNSGSISGSVFIGSNTANGGSTQSFGETNNYYGDGQQCLINSEKGEERKERKDVRNADTMNRMIDLIEHSSSVFTERLLHIEDAMVERNKLNTKLLDMISEKDSQIATLLKLIK